MPSHVPPSRDLIVGIDLGTTNSLVAVSDARGPRIIPDAQGRALLPSVVRYEAVDGDIRPVVGWEAKDRQAEFPLTTISSVKRLMGRSREDARGDLAFLPYRVIEGEHRTARVELVGIPALPAKPGEPAAGANRIVSPQEVSAAILRTLKARASAALGVEVRRAVVTVPAYFDDAQRQATRDAGRLAGLEVVRIVNEPTAAALAYGLGLERASDRHRGKESTVVVYDLGGGTFDVSVLKLTPAAQDGETSFFQVLATAGDTHLGGDDFDRVLAEAVVPGLTDPAARARLLLEAERAKRDLTDGDEATIGTPAGPAVVSRARFEELIDPLVARSMSACGRALRDAAKAAGRGPEDADNAGWVDAVILVGGSTRVPLVRRRVAERFGMEPYTALDPDQVVALGAAVQASVLSGASRGSLLLDVIPLSLGIETVGGAVAKLIVRNTTVPAKATEMFSTSVDGQGSIKLNVLQGEREMAEDCRSLGEFHLRGIPPMPAGIPQVQVTFMVDANGVLNVSAVERRSGKRAALQVVPNHGLTREEVERIETESYRHAREDMTRHRIVDLIANSKLDLKWIGERLDVLADKLEPAYRAQLEARLAALGAMVAAAQNDWRSVEANAFQAAKEALDRESVRLHEISIAESLKGTGGAGPGR
ncbi:MAG: Hsp70 family protein [Phycisphaerales bacterium]|nr:Hsp70 family protein [Phycisphaerales bacterium]